MECNIPALKSRNNLEEGTRFAFSDLFRNLNRPNSSPGFYNNPSPVHALSLSHHYSNNRLLLTAKNWIFSDTFNVLSVNEKSSRLNKIRQLAFDLGASAPELPPQFIPESYIHRAGKWQ